VELSCEDCHTSTEAWSQISPVMHPIELKGRHAEIGCFDCHERPNFRGLKEECTTCHERKHPYGSDVCTQCHSFETWQVDRMPEELHRFPQDHDSTMGFCNLCHLNRDFTTYTCYTCHFKDRMFAIHEEKEIEGMSENCIDCHPEGK